MGVANFSSPVVQEFARSLIKGFTHQLTGFDYPHFALETVHSFTDTLRYARINGRYSNTCYVPHVCAENLMILKLECIINDFAWSSFKSRGNSRRLDFSNLKLLELDLNIDFMFNELGDVWGYYACEFDYEIIAPKVETITLQLCPFTCLLLSSIYRIMAINDVKLEIREAYICFTGLNLDRGRRLFSSYAKNSKEDYKAVNMYSYMNNIFNIDGLAEYTKAEVGVDGSILDINRIDWKYLVDIDIHCSLHVNALRKLLSKLPSLRNVHIRELELHPDGEGIIEIVDYKATVEPTSSKVKCVTAVANFERTGLEMHSLKVYLDKLLQNGFVPLD